MPTTREMVATIKNDYLPDASDVKILAWLDRAQRFLFQNDCAQTTYCNSSDVDFPIPILSTTTGVLNYAVLANLVDSAGVAVTPTIGGYAVVPRRVKRVFIKKSVLSVGAYTNMFYGESFDWAGLNPSWGRSLYHTTFYEVPTILTDRNNLTDSGVDGAYVQFVEDPGTYSDRYYCEFYYDPVPLTSTSIPLSLNASLWEDALIDGVVGYAEDADSGKSERLDRFRSFWVKKFIRRMDANLSARRPLQMPVRECG